MFFRKLTIVKIYEKELEEQRKIKILDLIFSQIKEICKIMGKNKLTIYEIVDLILYEKKENPYLKMIIEELYYLCEKELRKKYKRQIDFIYYIVDKGFSEEQKKELKEYMKPHNDFDPFYYEKRN